VSIPLQDVQLAQASQFVRHGFHLLNFKMSCVVQKTIYTAPLQILALAAPLNVHLARIQVFEKIAKTDSY
jgi:hypothetical protein